jgi:hypothetical protein
VGSLGLVSLVVASGIMAAPAAPSHITALALAAAKTGLTFQAAFIRGIICNWLVCLGLWQARAHPNPSRPLPLGPAPDTPLRIQHGGADPLANGPGPARIGHTQNLVHHPRWRTRPQCHGDRQSATGSDWSTISRQPEATYTGESDGGEDPPRETERVREREEGGTINA